MTIGHRKGTIVSKIRVSCKALTVMAIASMMALGGLAALFCADDSSAAEFDDGVLRYTLKDTKLVLSGPMDKDLTELTIPDTVTYSAVDYPVYSVDEYAFKDCKKLKKVDMGNKVEGIELQAFYGCSALETIKFSSSLRYINGLAFAGCSSLKSLDFPASLYIISYKAFSECASLTSVEVPKTLESIDELAFVNCTSLKSINVAEDHESYSSVDGVMFNKAKTELRICPAGLSSYTVPKDVTSVAKAFSGDKLNKVEFVGGCKTTIGGGAFNSCSSLTIVIRSGADVTFESDSIVFGDLEQHTITVRSADDYRVPEVAYNPDYVKIVYKGLDDGTDPIWYIVGGVILALIIGGAIVYTVIKRRSQ